MLLMIASCQNESFDDAFIEEGSINVEELTGVQRDIMINILSSKFGGYRMGQPKTRAMNSISITPYVESGDTLLYVVQYAEGWEIYSASTSTNMVLFSSEHGHFDLDAPSFPPALKDIMSENTQGIKMAIQEDAAPVHPSWGAVSLVEKDFENGNATVNKNGQARAISYPDIPSGTWVLLESEVLSTDTYTSPKLVVTQWNQKSPWNRYSKMVNSENGLIRGVAGCVPIAIAQYLYHTNKLNNIPATTISKAVATIDGKDFTFLGNNSSLWDQMATTDGYFVSGLDESAMFIGYIGRQLNATYGENTTSVEEKDIAPFLAEVYGTGFTLDTFGYSYIKLSIDKKYPVVALAATNKTSSGNQQDYGRHAFLIDCYRETESTTKYVYGLIRDPWPEGSDDPYESNDVDEEGNIITWAYTNEIIKTNIINTQISMNWGYSSFYNNIFYSPYYDDWNAGGHAFNLDHQIYRRDDVR